MHLSPAKASRSREPQPTSSYKATLPVAIVFFALGFYCYCQRSDKNHPTKKLSKTSQPHSQSKDSTDSSRNDLVENINSHKATDDDTSSTYSTNSNDQTKKHPTKNLSKASQRHSQSKDSIDSSHNDLVENINDHKATIANTSSSYSTDSNDQTKEQLKKRNIPNHNVGSDRDVMKIISVWLREEKPNSYLGGSIVQNHWVYCHTQIFLNFLGKNDITTDDKTLESDKKLSEEEVNDKWNKRVAQEKKANIAYLQRLAGNGEINNNGKFLNDHITLPKDLLPTNRKHESTGNFTFPELPLVMSDHILEEETSNHSAGTITYKATQYQRPDNIIYNIGNFASEEQVLSELRKDKYKAYSFFPHPQRIQGLLRLRTLSLIHGMVGFISYTYTVDDIDNYEGLKVVFKKDAVKRQTLAELKEKDPAFAIKKIEEALQHLLQLGYTDFSFDDYSISYLLNNIYVSSAYKGIFYYSSTSYSSSETLLKYWKSILPGDIKDNNVRNRFRKFWRELLLPFSGSEQLQSRIAGFDNMNLEATKKILINYISSFTQFFPLEIITVIVDHHVGFFSPSDKLKNEILPSFIANTTFAYGKKWNILDPLFQCPFSIEKGRFYFFENLIKKIKKGVVTKKTVKENIERFKKYFSQFKKEELLSKMKEKLGLDNYCFLANPDQRDTDQRRYLTYHRALEFPEPTFFDRMLPSSNKEENQKDSDGLAPYVLYARFCQDIYTMALIDRINNDVVYRASSFQYYPKKRALFKFIFPLSSINVPYCSLPTKTSPPIDHLAPQGR